jgi:PhzF family phenazine biosynthesis protein
MPVYLKKHGNSAMNILRRAAFSDKGIGGNPAGVVIVDEPLTVARMQTIARDVGYSETAFASPSGNRWRVRYFAPETEVAFCGHATIALGAAFGARFGAGTYDLDLTTGSITVSAKKAKGGWSASLQSPRTWSKPLPKALFGRLLGLLDLSPIDLDPGLPPTLAFAGVRHAILSLHDRARLSAMAYDFEAMRVTMQDADLTTVSLLHITSKARFSSRNAFAIGGVVEDPATGAAAAALGGALVDLGWPHLQGGGEFVIHQGQDMGQPSRLQVEVTGRPGDSVRVSGAVREIG